MEADAGKMLINKESQGQQTHPTDDLEAVHIQLTHEIRKLQLLNEYTSTRSK